MILLDGKAISAKVKDEIKAQANALKKAGVEPSLAVILVGDDKASQIYVSSKEKACAATNINSIMHRLNANTTQNELLKLINELNLDDRVDGILVQLPLPKHIDTNAVIEAIDPKKDVDGFCAINVGKLTSGLSGFTPCTPLGVMRLLKEYDINVAGLNALIIGRSNIVGKPMASLLLNAGATITIAHSKTKNLKELCISADLIVAAIGKPNFITADMVKQGAIIIDVGINRLDDGRITGDVDFNAVAPKASYITPVPGGVGVMTIAMLLSNTIISAKARAARLGLKI